MDFRSGSRITVLGHKVGASARAGTVVDALPSGMLRVEWDDGGMSMFVPGTDARAVDDERSGEVRFGCQVDMRLTETDDACEAEATLMTQRGTFRARARARRHPDDAPVPMIGEELAIARALRALAGQLESAADDAITRREDRALHLL